MPWCGPLEAQGAVIDPASASYVVLGSVTLKDVGQRPQEVEILWEVLDDTSHRLGQISQGNTVLAGQLDGAWGVIADTVAYAGALGVLGGGPQRTAEVVTGFRPAAPNVYTWSVLC